MRKTGFGTVLLLGAALVGPSAAAQAVGAFAVVQNKVTSLKPNATEAQPAKQGELVELGELETTGPMSAAKLTLGEGAVISIGQRTEFKLTEQAFEEATGVSVSKLDLASGKMRVFVSRFMSGRPQVEVNTPTASAGIKGSEVLIEVASDGGTRVTVFSGHADVRAKQTGGGTRSLGARQQVSVSQSGDLGEPIVIDDSTVRQLWLTTEARADAPRGLPLEQPVFPVPDDWAAVWPWLGGIRRDTLPLDRLIPETVATETRTINSGI